MSNPTSGFRIPVAFCTDQENRTEVNYCIYVCMYMGTKIWLSFVRTLECPRAWATQTLWRISDGREFSEKATRPALHLDVYVQYLKYFYQFSYTNYVHRLFKPSRRKLINQYCKKTAKFPTVIEQRFPRTSPTSSIPAAHNTLLRDIIPGEVPGRHEWLSTRNKNPQNAIRGKGERGPFSPKT